jgi:hypothetical protein
VKQASEINKIVAATAAVDNHHDIHDHQKTHEETIKEEVSALILENKVESEPTIQIEPIANV